MTRYSGHETSCFSGGYITDGTLGYIRLNRNVGGKRALSPGFVRSSNNYCAMFDALPAAFLAFLILDSAHAQVSAPNCSDGSYLWVGHPSNQLLLAESHW